MKASSQWSIMLEPVSDPQKAESVTGSCTRRVLSGLFVAVLTAIGLSGAMSGCSGGGGGSDKTTLYIDADLDGYGSNASDAATIKASLKDAVADSSGTVSLTQDGVAYVNNATDCNDSDVNINPAMADMAGDGIDQNCDGADEAAGGVSVPPGGGGGGEGGTSATDDDGDGYTEDLGDCNDADAAINPGATETNGDGIDSNCDENDNVTSTTDADSDGIASDVDCNDSDATIGGPTTYYADTDGDGYGSAGSTTSSCETTAPSGYTTDTTDCDDTNANVNPGVSEDYFHANGGTDTDTSDKITHGDGIDNDCDEQVDETECTCDSLTGYVSPSSSSSSFLLDIPFVGEASAGVSISKSISLPTKINTGVTGIGTGTPSSKKIFDRTGIAISCDSSLDIFKTLPGWDCEEKVADGGTGGTVAEVCDNGTDDDANGSTDCADSACSGSSTCWGSTVVWRGALWDYTEPECAWFDAVQGFVNIVNDVLKTFGAKEISANDLEYNGTNLEFHRLRSYLTDIKSDVNTATGKVTTTWNAETRLDYGDPDIWKELLVGNAMSIINAMSMGIPTAIDTAVRIVCPTCTGIEGYLTDTIFDFDLNVSGYKTFPSDYKNYYTVVAFNKGYLQARLDHITIDCTDAGMKATGNEGHCKGTLATDLTENFDATWLAGKKVFVLLRGFSQDYEGPKEQNAEVEDAVVAVSVPEALGSDGKTTVTAEVNFNGETHNKKDYKAIVYYTLFVADPAYVDSGSLDPFSTTLTSGYYEGTGKVSGLSVNPTSSSQVIVGAGTWGFNNSAGLPMQDMMEYVKFEKAESSGPTVRVKGRLFYEGCAAPDVTWKPNDLHATVITCKDKNVCVTSEGTAEGSMSKADDSAEDAGSKDISVTFTK